MAADASAGRAAFRRPGLLNRLWEHHAAQWRDPAQVASQWQEAGATDPELLGHRVRGAWWETLAATGAVLLVTREYEHLVMALRVGPGGPAVSFMRLPHPSGLVVDRRRGRVHVASTRNPNQVYDLVPATTRAPAGADTTLAEQADDAQAPVRPLVPVRSRFLPGSLYLHDLALIGSDLHANAVGHNAVIRIDDDGCYRHVWWPRCVDMDGRPRSDRNYLQLNSIAAGPDPCGSFFSASADSVSARRPGHRNFPVDRRGVVFSGATGEPIVRGLTRPHSARLHAGTLWVDNSGYGELGVVADGRFEAVVRLPGWTRGLCVKDHIAFVGTSRVIPRFRQYAPGLDVESSLCGIHAVETGSGRVLGSLLWPAGNQIFAIDWAPTELTSGLPFGATGKRATRRQQALFFAFTTDDQEMLEKTNGR